MGDGGPAASAQIAQPEGMAIDGAGNLYIADAANHRVRKVSDGVITTVAGNGHGGFSGDGGPAAAAQLNQPYDVTLDAAGNLYIADFGNQRVRKVDTTGNITTAAGDGSSGSNGDGGQATAAMLLGPRNVVTDAVGNLYISEFDGHRVRRVAPDGTISTVAGTGIAGLGGDGGPATASQLAFPAGLALDGAGNLFIVDSSNVRIRKVLAGAGTISTVCTQLSFGMPYIQLTGLAAGAGGNLYIPEKGNSYVWQLTPAGAMSIVAGTPGEGTYTGDGHLATATALSSPVGAALDASGNLFIAETHRVRYVAAATGIIATVGGDGTFGFGGDGGSAISAVLNTPTGLAFNNGTLFIADQQNHRVRVVSAAGAISTVAGDGGPANTGDGLAALNASLALPDALAFDPAGNLYIADMNANRVRRVDATGIITTFAGNGGVGGYGSEGTPAALMSLNAPQGLAADSLGNVYVSDTNNNRVIQVDTAGDFHTVAGTGTAGSAGDGTTLGELYGPVGLAVDGQDNLYIADCWNHRIRMLSPGSAITTIAGTGTSGFSGDGGAATAAALSYPAGVAVDGSGNIFIADSGNQRVRIVTPDGNITTIAGTGSASYNGDSGAALDIALDNPYGLTVDAKGNIYVADSGNNRVRMMSVGQAAVTTVQPVTVTTASAASLAAGPLAPGEIFSIFAGAGQSMGPSVAAYGVFGDNGTLSTNLAGVQVLFNSIPAALFYAQASQINAQTPYEMAGLTSAELQVMYQGNTLVTMQVALADANPALFTLSSGTGNVVAVNQDGSINSDANPAERGSFVVLYATGEGQTSPAGESGQAAAAPYPQPVLPVSLSIGGITADLLFAAEAPGFAGLLQINAQIPSGFIPAGDLPVLLSVGAYQSPSGVTIAVK